MSLLVPPLAEGQSGRLGGLSDVDWRSSINRLTTASPLVYLATLQRKEAFGNDPIYGPAESAPPPRSTGAKGVAASFPTLAEDQSGRLVSAADVDRRCIIKRPFTASPLVYLADSPEERNSMFPFRSVSSRLSRGRAVFS